MRDQRLHLFDFLKLVSDADPELGEKTQDLQKRILNEGLPRYPRSQPYCFLLKRLSKKFGNMSVPAEKSYSYQTKTVLAWTEKPLLYHDSNFKIRQTNSGSRTYWMENQHLYLVFYLLYDGTVHHSYLEGKINYSSQFKKILNPDLTIKIAEHMAEENGLWFRQSRFEVASYYGHEAVEKIPKIPIMQQTLSEVIKREYERLDQQIRDAIKS